MGTALVNHPNELDLSRVNRQLHGHDPTAIVRWSVKRFGDGLAITSSFGAHSAVMLDLITRVVPDIPVIFIDTGFLFPETYCFADALTDRFGLNLKVYQSPLSPARMVARFGSLWEQGVDGLNRYDQIRKIEPMQRALRELKVTAWLAGLRHEQTPHRQQLGVVDTQDNVYKVHPILDWSTLQLDQYLKKHDLPHHPLYAKGFKSIGDWHSTVPVAGDESDRAGRFQGLKQECGIHLPQTKAENLSRESSSL